MDSIVADHAAGEGEAETPFLALDGFNGSLERLLKLARAQQIDLARLSLGTLVVPPVYTYLLWTKTAALAVRSHGA